MMRSLLIALCLFASVAQAQVGQIPAWPPNQPLVSTAYVGPGDIASGAYAWWGLRAYTTALRGNALANVCNSTSGPDTCQDMLSDATTGALVPATFGGGACPGTNCTVKILYDQSGSNSCFNGSFVACDFSQAVVANRPALKANCVGTQPCLDFSSGSPVLTSVQTPPGTVTQPFSVAGVANSGSTASSDWFNQGVTTILRFDSGTSFGIYSGAAVPAVATSANTWYAAAVTANGASTVISVNGASSMPGNPGSNGIAGSTALSLGQSGFSTQFTKWTTDVGLWTSDISSSFSALSTNEKAFWGF